MATKLRLGKYATIMQPIQTKDKRNKEKFSQKVFNIKKQ